MYFSGYHRTFANFGCLKGKLELHNLNVRVQDGVMRASFSVASCPVWQARSAIQSPEFINNEPKTAVKPNTRTYNCKCCGTLDIPLRRIVLQIQDHLFIDIIKSFPSYSRFNTNNGSPRHLAQNDLFLSDWQYARCVSDKRAAARAVCGHLTTWLWRRQKHIIHHIH